MIPPPDLVTLLEDDRRFARHHYPAVQLEEVALRFAGGARPARFPVPPAVCPAEMSPASAGVIPLTDRQADLLEAMLGLAPGEKVSGKEIAKRAGHPYDSGIRADRVPRTFRKDQGPQPRVLATVVALRA